MSAEASKVSQSRSARPALRLAFIAPGNSIHTRRWLEYFAQRGHDVGLISYGRFEEPMDGIELLDELTAFSRVRHGLRGYLDFVTAARRVRRVVRRFAPDVVHAHFVTGPGWLGVLSGTGPLVVTAWGSDVLVDPNKSVIVRALHRLTFHRAACVMCDAEGVAERLADLGATPVRIRRALWGVDVDHFAPRESDPRRRAAFGLPAEGVVVLSIRGLRDLQNPLTVVRAFAAMRSEHPDATLALKLGPADSELAPAVAAEIDALGLGAAVAVVGHMPHDELADLYRSADICLSVPSSDGTSVALLEAMAAGRPVIVSDIPANREWVTDGESGKLVPAGDVQALSSALVELAGSPDLRAALGAAARTSVEVEGSYHHQMRRAELLYRSVIWERAHS